MESDTIDDTHEEQRPMRSTLGLGDVAVVIDGQEDVCDTGKIGYSSLDACRITVLHEQECHGRPEEHDVCLRILGEDLTLEEFLPESDVLADMSNH
jgi:hypothetical protein